MECLHTHPVLVYFSSIANEKMDKRYQFSRLNKREMRQTEMYAYTRRERARFRWYLAYTLIRNIHLVQSRKHQIVHLQLSSAESFNEFLERKVFNRFQMTLSKHPFNRSQGNITNDLMDLNHHPRHQTTACTTLLLDDDEHKGRFPSISKNFP